MQALRDDAVLKRVVAGLKHRFLSKAGALLHGDIRSGSLFVAEGEGRIDPAAFGPAEACLLFGGVGYHCVVYQWLPCAEVVCRQVSIVLPALDRVERLNCHLG